MAAEPPRESPDCPLAYFGSQVENCLSFARRRKDEGAKIVGIMCE